MRLYEFATPNPSDSLDSDLTNVLAAAKGKGVAAIPTQQLVSILVGMGHTVNDASIMSLLGGNPFVQDATPTEVTVSRDEQTADDGMGAEVDTKGKVEQMAQNQAGDIGQDLV